MKCVLMMRMMLVMLRCHFIVHAPVELMLMMLLHFCFPFFYFFLVTKMGTVFFLYVVLLF